MKLARLEHMALSVADIQRSIQFYCDVLGLELIREMECGPDTPLGQVVGLPGCRARIAHLMCGDTMLELFEYIEPRGEAVGPGRRQADHGFIHIGFQSSDVPGDFVELQRRGVRFVHDPIEFRPGVWIAYFYGPDGEVCEVRQTPSGKTSA